MQVLFVVLFLNEQLSLVFLGNFSAQGRLGPAAALLPEADFMLGSDCVLEFGLVDLEAEYGVGPWFIELVVGFPWRNSFSVLKHIFIL